MNSSHANLFGSYFPGEPGLFGCPLVIRGVEASFWWPPSTQPTALMQWRINGQATGCLACCETSIVKLRRVELLMKLHLRAMSCHLPYMGSLNVSYHPSQVNTPRLNTSQRGQYSIFLSWRNGRLSWPTWPVIYRDGLAAHTQSPIQILTRQCELATCWSQVRCPNHYTTKPPVSTQCRQN